MKKIFHSFCLVWMRKLAKTPQLIFVALCLMIFMTGSAIAAPSNAINASTDTAAQNIQQHNNHRHFFGYYVPVSFIFGITLIALIWTRYSQIVTTKKNAKLLKRIEKYEILAENSMDTIWTTDLNFNITYINRKVQGLLGYSPKELTGTNTLNYISKNYTKDMLAKANQIIEAHKRGNPIQQTMDIKMIHKDGTPVDIELTANLLTNENGEPSGFQGRSSNITERMVVKQERNLLMLAIEQAAECIVITDTTGAIVYVNPIFEQLTGYTCKEAIGKNPRILKSNEHDKDFYETMWNTLLNGKTWKGTFVNKKKNGDIYSEEAVISPVHNNSGKITNYVAVKRDITDELQQQDQLRQAQKLESIGTLTCGIAHDFNNMLMGIMGFSELALQKIEKTNPAHEWVEEVINIVNHSASLTRQLLTFSRKQEITPEELDINDATVKILKMLRRLISEEIQLVLKPSADISSVMMDPTQFDQILTNLCINSNDAINGTGEITIKTDNVTIGRNHHSTDTEVKPGEYALLTITDTGSGMNKKTVEHIFDPFFTTKEVGKGTGMGLATVYGIIKQNNGFVEVNSKPGSGTTIKIYLPIFETKSKNIIQTQTPDKIIIGNETILLVEDQKHILETLKIFLTNLGYTVLSTKSPNEALSIAKHHSDNISLLLTDVVMPGMSGFDLAKELSTQSQTMKALFISSYTNELHEKHADIKSKIRLLPKPVTQAKLADEIRLILDSKSILPLSKIF